MLERDIERKLGEHLKALGCLYYKFVSPGQRGVPDRIVICPDGKVVFVELKQPKGLVATIQDVQHARLVRNGQMVVLVWNMIQAEEFTDWVRVHHTRPVTSGAVWTFGAGEEDNNEP